MTSSNQRLILSSATKFVALGVFLNILQLQLLLYVVLLMLHSFHLVVQHHPAQVNNRTFNAMSFPVWLCKSRWMACSAFRESEIPVRRRKALNAFAEMLQNIVMAFKKEYRVNLQERECGRARNLLRLSWKESSCRALLPTKSGPFSHQTAVRCFKDRFREYNVFFTK